MNEKVKSGINKAYWYGQRRTLGSDRMKLKPYPKYKDSGIQWIGKIPEGWNAERFKIRFKSKKGKIPENLEEINGESYLPYLSMEYLRGTEDGVLFSNDPKALKVEEDDLLLLWDGSNAGEFISAKKGYLSSTMVKLRSCPTIS